MLHLVALISGVFLGIPLNSGESVQHICGKVGGNIRGKDGGRVKAGVIASRTAF
ncbi:hypothetical protein [Erythrobacter sp. EC-HK427]|uniref:hypothetical protein n=1 Tax=Erythrobacter sp. EC-HK427 TaxID=2038396 RepID=UPI0018FE7AF4|nr:hypothetical protein [Erythrobacter sp. EC-HK427]